MIEKLFQKYLLTQEEAGPLGRLRQTRILWKNKKFQKIKTGNKF